MRAIRYLIIALVLLILVGLALSNREWVTLRLLHDELAEQLFLPTGIYDISLPLFAIVFASLLIGAFLGYSFEYLREGKIRREARRTRKESERLSSELKKMRAEKAKGDDVMAILEEAERS